MTFQDLYTGWIWRSAFIIFLYNSVHLLILQTLLSRRLGLYRRVQGQCLLVFPMPGKIMVP